MEIHYYMNYIITNTKTKELYMTYTITEICIRILKYMETQTFLVDRKLIS